MKNIFYIILILLFGFLFIFILIFNRSKNDFDLSKTTLCEYKLSSLQNNFPDLKQTKSQKGDVEIFSEKLKGVIFVKGKGDYIKKIKLNRNFKGKLVDGTNVDLSNLSIKKFLVNHPKFTKSSDSEDVFLTDGISKIYVDKVRYPIMEFYPDNKTLGRIKHQYDNKIIEEIVIELNCHKEIAEDFGIKNPNFILNGKRIKSENLDKLYLKNINSVNALSPSSSKVIYGTEGNNGTIIITTNNQ